MSNVCKNCGAVFEGNYCNNCGQPAATHDINTSFVVHDLQHGLMHINGGILHSARELFSRPGHSIREYIEGKRMKHYKPLSMLIILAGLYSLFYHALGINVLSGVDDGLLDYEEANEWISHHFSIISLLLLPILSLSSYIVFKKQGYNYTEHIVLNSFYSSQKLWVRIVTVPLLLFKDMETLLPQVLMGVDFVLMLWCYKQFFTKTSMLKAVGATLLAYSIGLLVMLLVLTSVLLILLNDKIPA